MVREAQTGLKAIVTWLASQPESGRRQELEDIGVRLTEVSSRYTLFVDRAKNWSNEIAWKVAVLISLTTLTGCPWDPVPVTGTGPEDPTNNDEQSETALAVSHGEEGSLLIVTYNDGTGNDGLIDYTPETRVVRRGASLLGWSYSEDMGKTWHYGGKVRPPVEHGWVVLWGDPAIVTSRVHPNNVYVSNLAVPEEKYDEQGLNGDMRRYLGGACIARSTDGGRHFEIHQCFTHDFHFYDGGSMASGSDGAIYASFYDAAPGVRRIDVWKADGDEEVFYRLPSPFPGMKIGSHPRIRVEPTSNTLFVVATELLDRGGNRLWISRWDGAGWSTPRVAAGPDFAPYPHLEFAENRRLRTGPQFSFDVVEPALSGNEWPIHVVYTARDQRSGRYYVATSVCQFDLSRDCLVVHGWSTNYDGKHPPKGDQFNPLIRARVTRYAWHLGSALWKVSYTTREDDPDGKTVSWRQGNQVVARGQRLFFPLPLVGPHEVCPTEFGYWGDYDDLQLILPGRHSLFVRAFSDSSQGCDDSDRWRWTTRPLHVSTVVFP